MTSPKLAASERTLVEQELRDTEAAIERGKDQMTAARVPMRCAQARAHQLRRKLMPPVDAAIASIGKEKWRRFATALTASAAPGASIEAAAGEAVRCVFPSWKKPQAVASKAREMLARPEMCAVMDALFEQSGFTIEDAVRHHTQLVQSDDPRVRQKALDTYYRLVIPKPALEVEHRAKVDLIERTVDAPAIRARSLTSDKESR
ncbi:MAG: hypothetical protein GIW99_01820 [Candidatus Eremiobacteraeota bacterium]|nr:hypothetical protein [Candidatus Eremiobacteraeota bacterium]MBC5826413.1 hypothetical protein [Candidatus Eremiobacteraeota bacterium]